VMVNATSEKTDQQQINALLSIKYMKNSMSVAKIFTVYS
jgi:hypothetical protein